MAKHEEEHVREIHKDEAPLLATVLVRTVRATNAVDYDPEQIETWTTIARVEAEWQKRLASLHTFVCTVDGEIAGFASLDREGYLDLLYVALEFQRRGIATRLVAAIESRARALGVAMIVTDASITARPFFERRGFSVVRPQTVRLHGVEFTNFRMIRLLYSANGAT